MTKQGTARLSSVLTDFSPDEYVSIEVAAAAKGWPLATWVAEAVRLYLGARPVYENGEPRSPSPRPDAERIQVRIRIEPELAALLVEEAKGAAIGGTSTLIREVALVAAGAAPEQTISGRSAIVAKRARGRTASLQR